MYLSVTKEVAMIVSGLVLITVCLANVLAVQAECCQCDCQVRPKSTHQHSQLYYIPVVPSQQNAAHLEGQIAYENLAAVSLSNIGHIAQVAPTGNANYQSANKYQVVEESPEGSLDIGQKVQGNLEALGYGNGQRRLYGYGESDASDSSNEDVKQKEVSKVSTHLGTHYINIEKQIGSEQHSVKGDHMENQEDQQHGHHGKNDYYKFEYAVNDKKTHDIKRHKEEKKGDVVEGEYSLVEDGGNVRTVKYYADWKTGFHAQVHNSKSLR